MGDLENNILMILGFLLLCLLLSVYFASDNKSDNNSFGFKCNKGSLGPGKGYCERVNQAPNTENGLYLNARDCIQKCSNVLPQPSVPFGFKCNNKGSLGPGKGYCELVNEVPNKQNGVYSNAIECLRACGDPVKNFMCTGPAGCIPTDMKENGKNVFSTLEECMYKCKNPDEPNPNFMCTGPLGCIPTDMKENGKNVFSTLEECMYKCKNPDEPNPNFMCTGPLGCIPTDMKENGKNVFSTLEECNYKCKKQNYINGPNGCIPTDMKEDGINIFSSYEECIEKELKDYLDSL